MQFDVGTPPPERDMILVSNYKKYLKFHERTERLTCKLTPLFKTKPHIPYSLENRKAAKIFCLFLFQNELERLHE